MSELITASDLRTKQLKAIQDRVIDNVQKAVMDTDSVDDTQVLVPYVIVDGEADKDLLSLYYKPLVDRGYTLHQSTIEGHFIMRWGRSAEIARSEREQAYFLRGGGFLE